MWLKIFSVLALMLQVSLQLIQSLSRIKQRDEDRAEMSLENEKIIGDKAHEADIIRSSKLGDELLLAPAARCDGGVHSIRTDLCRVAAGSGDAGETPAEREIKSAQPDLGKQLSAADFKLPKRKVEKVFIHCSASDRPEDDNVRTINQWHIARGWSEIGYNFYIDKHGRIWTGRDIEKIPAAQHGHNTGSIAICCGGLSLFTVAQFLSLQEFCGIINKTYSGKITFHGHCEVSTKTCPNFDYKSVLHDIIQP